MAEKIWSEQAWKDYLFWQENDKKILKKINALIKDIERNGEIKGIGNPEALKGNLSGEYSRHIDDKNRIVYHMKENKIYIAQCKGHYNDR